MLTPKVEGMILEFSKCNLTIRAIKEKLKNENIQVSIGTICHVLNGIGKTRKARAKNEEIPKQIHPRPQRNKVMLQKLDKIIRKKSPPSQRSAARKLNVSLATVNRAIHQDLSLLTRKKRKVHRLNAAQKKNRKVNARKMYERHLAGSKGEYVVTLDEAYFYLDDCEGERKICYVKKGENTHEDFYYQCKESFRKGFMVVGCLTGRGTVPLIRVPNKVKVTGQYYVDYVLRPILEEFVPNLYPEELHKVFLHHDKATSHTCRFTQEYLRNLQLRTAIDFIRNEDIPVKSPDASPLDFFGFGFLKQKLFDRRARTMDGVWKVLQALWRSISVQDVQKVYKAWKRRCRLVYTNDGEHIEHVHQLHRRIVKV